MSVLAALRRDVQLLTPAQALIVTLTPLGAFTLGCLIVFPARFFA
ncbi:hypothetical protein [Methylobacterium soli]|nr:hypothetical protein [Methylobacterium soli]GJE46911.1 hypothetical protein AEGHOMDF_6120 [Methylobacterium soli]